MFRFTAYSVIKTLKGLAESGKTILATIHQPSSEIFYLFDNLLLLSQGQIMYQGPLKDSVSYFAKLGYECPQYTNPSDFIFMSILNNDENALSPYLVENSNESHAQRIERLLQVWNDSIERKSLQNIVENQQNTGIPSTMMKVKADLKIQVI